MKYFKLVLACLMIGCTSSALAQNHLTHVVEYPEEVSYLISLLEEDLTEKRKQEFYTMFPVPDKKLPNKRQKESKSEIYYELETSGYEVKYFKITQPKQKKEQLTFFGKSTYSEIKSALCESENFVCPTSNQTTYINSIDLKLSRLVILEFDPKTGLLNHIEYSGSRTFQNKFSDGLPQELCSFTPTIAPKNIQLNASGICLEGNCESWKGTMQYGNLVFKGTLKNGIPNGYGNIYFVDGCKWFNVKNKPSEYIEAEFKNGIAQGAFRFKTDRYEGVPRDVIFYENGKPSRILVPKSENTPYGYKSKITPDFKRHDDSAVIDIPKLGKIVARFENDQLIVPDKIYEFRDSKRLLYKGRLDQSLKKTGYGQYQVDHSDLILSSFFKNNRLVLDSITSIRMPEEGSEYIVGGYLTYFPWGKIELERAQAKVSLDYMEGIQLIKAEKLLVDGEDFVPIGRVELYTAPNGELVHNENDYGTYDKNGYFILNKGKNYFNRPINPVISRGKLKDPRDGTVYNTATLRTYNNKLVTMFTQNLAYDGAPRNTIAYSKYGLAYYSRKALRNLCPPGWRIPSSDDIINIIEPFSTHEKVNNGINFSPNPSLESLELFRDKSGYYTANDHISSERGLRLNGDRALFWITDAPPGHFGVLVVEPGATNEAKLTYRKDWDGQTDYLTCRCIKDGSL
ncbi:FISUMP domain-containing protein [Roseivirga pacifica]|uniref:FISUMP domain-containing protein n=1 Tax=Roseivirga pacifica TaxID=1267423 RepID=UPI00227B9675|nr:FISUMP domain-containing protein [Roseivirga pacifica]